MSGLAHLPAEYSPRITTPNPVHSMANIALAIYLILVGLVTIADLSIPPVVMGILALVAGILMLVPLFGGKK